jgi:hypothetical protein
MKIHFATWLTDRTHGMSLTKKRAVNRLLSYHFLGDQGITDEQFRLYCKIGRLDIRKNKKR